MDEPILSPIDMNFVDVPKYIPDFLSIHYSKIPNAGLGIFANENIQQGTFIGNYMGEILTDTKNHEMSNYCFSGRRYDNSSFFLEALDIEKSNFARYMNCCYNENIENVIVMSNKTNGENTKYINSTGKEINIDGYIFFYAKRDIQKGEELLYNYGPEYQEKLGIKM